MNRPLPTILFIVVAALGLLASALRAATATTSTPRQLIAAAVVAEDAAKKRELIGQLMGSGDPAIAPLLEAWRTDTLFVFTAPDGARIPVLLAGDKDDAGKQPAARVDTGAPLTDAAGAPLRLAAADLTAADHTSLLRRAMKAVLDLADLAAPPRPGPDPGRPWDPLGLARPSAPRPGACWPRGA